MSHHLAHGTEVQVAEHLLPWLVLCLAQALQSGLERTDQALRAVGPGSIPAPRFHFEDSF